MSLSSKSLRLAKVTEARLARLYADGRRSLRRRSVVDLPTNMVAADRRDAQAWNERTAAEHAAYRLAVEPVDGRVAVVCSSHRPQDLPTILDSLRCQTHSNLELVFVAHGEHWATDEIEAHLGPLEHRLQRLQIISMPASATLGDCLNNGMDRTDARFVAKLDGDDRYGPHYLEDLLRAHAISDAGIVGKHTYYAYLQPTDEYVLRFPGHEFEYTSTMSGGTFLIDRDVVDDQRFGSLSIGEDRDFILRCHRRGISTFSGDRFNYTVVRSGDNTWTVDDDRFTARSIRFAADWSASEIDR